MKYPLGMSALRANMQINTNITETKISHTLPLNVNEAFDRSFGCSHFFFSLEIKQKTVFQYHHVHWGFLNAPHSVKFAIPNVLHTDHIVFFLCCFIFYPFFFLLCTCFDVVAFTIVNSTYFQAAFCRV